MKSNNHVIILAIGVAVIPTVWAVVGVEDKAGEKVTQVTEATVAETTESAVVLICHTKPDIANVQGTGFFVDPNGTLVTADHVLYDEGAKKPYDSLYAIYFTGEKHRWFRLRVARRYRNGTNKGRDLALLKPMSPPDTNLPYLKIGHSAIIGDEILVAGFPLVFEKPYAYPLVRRGVIASTRYSFEGHNVLILDLPMVPGFSGSPVVDVDTGRVVAVLKGFPEKRPNTDFCMATVINEDDAR